MADLHLDSVNNSSEVLSILRKFRFSNYSTTWDEENNQWPTLSLPLICGENTGFWYSKTSLFVKDRITFKPYLGHRALQKRTQACSVSLSPEEVAYGHIVPCNLPHTRTHNTDTHTHTHTHTRTRTRARAHIHTHRQRIMTDGWQTDRWRYMDRWIDGWLERYIDQSEVWIRTVGSGQGN